MFTSPISLLASAARTVSGVSAVVDLAQMTTVKLTLDVTAVSGVSPTLLVTVETSPDGVAYWSAVGSFSTQSTVVAKTLTFPGCQRYVRASYTIGGTTPSFTFAVSGLAILVYATPGNVRSMSLPAEALSGATDAQIDEAIQYETAVADGYLGTQFKLPLTTWGDDLRINTADRAGYRLMRRRGFNPNDGADQIIVKTYDDAMKWLKGVADGTVHPTGVGDTTPVVSDTQAVAEIYTDLGRGW